MSISPPRSSAAAAVPLKGQADLVRCSRPLYLQISDPPLLTFAPVLCHGRKRYRAVQTQNWTLKGSLRRASNGTRGSTVCIFTRRRSAFHPPLKESLLTWVFLLQRVFINCRPTRWICQGGGLDGGEEPLCPRPGYAGGGGGAIPSIKCSLRQPQSGLFCYSRKMEGRRRRKILTNWSASIKEQWRPARPACTRR